MAWPSDSTRSKTWATEILTSADQHAQLDLLHTYLNDCMDGSTGHGHTGGANDGKQIVLTTAVTGTLPVANGGTGQATLAAFLNLIYPVGSIYMNDEVSTNPGTLLGFGTWTAITGKMIVGVDSGDTDFDTAKETGGAKTSNALIAHTHELATTNDSNTGGTGGVFRSTAAAEVGINVTTESAGSGSSFSIMNPYYAAYIWRRSA